VYLELGAELSGTTCVPVATSPDSENVRWMGWSLDDSAGGPMTESSPAGTHKAVRVVGWPVGTAESQMMIRGLYLENGNRDQNLVYKRQWGHCVLPRYASSILGLCYAIQVSMERRRNGGGKGEGGERCV
jgi:hypothetical protein